MGTTRAADAALRRGSADVLVMSILEERPRHGYDIAKLIARRSNGVLTFHAASLYPLLYRMEARGWIQGRWVEKAGERRRRFYRISAEGLRVLDMQRKNWRQFVAAMTSIVGGRYA